MEILPFHFKTLSYCGVWSENIRFTYLKSVYKIAVFTLIICFTITQIIEFLRTCDSVEDSTQVMFYCFTFIALCFKLLNFVLRQKEMLRLIRKFRSEICQPNSAEEWAIFKNHNREINRIFLTYLLLTFACAAGYWPSPLFQGEWKNFTLPYKTYQPYEITNIALYTSTYIFQVLAGFYGIVLNISFDSMVYGFFLLISAQYEIFYHRLIKIDDQCGKFPMKKYVDQHVLIQDLITSTQSFFMLVVTPLFFFSLITLGASIFKIIQMTSIIEIVAMAFYLMSILFQIFLFCWHGNELTIKSQNVIDAIYNSNWLKLDPIERKGLKFMMQMSARERVISHHGQCCLNLNTFVWILKTSYSALNLLQQGVKE